MYLHLIVVYPGSELYRYACQKGIIKNRAEFIRDGCPFINISKLSEKEYRQMLVDISMETKSSEHLENVKVEYIGAGKVQIEADCPKCHEKNQWRGMDTFRNLGLLRCRCNNSIFVVASNYVDSKIIEKNFLQFQNEKVGLWPTISAIQCLREKIPQLIDGDNVFFIDISNMKNEMSYKGKNINLPAIINDEDITTIFLTSTSPFLVTDILQMIKRDFKNVTKVLFIGDLADSNFDADSHNLL